MKRILIINVNWRGDVLFSTPFIRAIRQRFPDSYIGCLIVPRCKEVLDNNPAIDKLIVYDEAGLHKGFLGKFRFISNLRSERFDSVFILHRSFTRTILATLAGIEERIGYYTKKRGFLLTKKVEVPIGKIHKVEYFLNIARAVGIDTKDKDYEFVVPDNDRKYACKFLKESGIGENDFLGILNPGGNWALKRWPKENFAKLGDKLAKDYNARILITGAQKDIELAKDILSLMETKPIIACGKTTLKELGALMARANLVISNDSGPMHIAVSQKTKVIALFGPTSPLITGPYGSGDYTVIWKDVGCNIPCYNLTCIDNKCMRAITVEDVLKKVRDFC